MSASASAQHRSLSKNKSVKGSPLHVSDAIASEPLSDSGKLLGPDAASAVHSPSSSTQSEGDGPDLSANATPSSDAARVQRHQSSDIQSTERQSAAGLSTSEAVGPLATPNVRFTPSINEHQLTRDEQPEADQREPPTNASAVPVPPRAPTFKRFLKLFDILTGMGMLRCLLVLFILSIGIGITVFDRFMHFGGPTTFSPGDNRKPFADPPNTRGAFDIITACSSTILTCVYTSLHLDVPYPREGDADEGEGDVEKDEKRKPSNEEIISRAKEWIWRERDVESGEGTAHGQEPRWRRWAKMVTGRARKGVKEVASWPKRGAKKVASWPRKLWIQIKSMKRRAVWVVFNIVAPELVAYVAVREFLSAKNNRREMVDYFRSNLRLDISKKWTIAHQHMAEMGGFKVPSEEGGYFILSCSSDFYRWASFNPEAFKKIDYKQVGIDIENCSKADGLLKACTVIQASWLVVQTIERACKGLSITELEVTTCAYVACAIFTYACWWNKPYGLRSHISLHVPSTPPLDWPPETDSTPFNRYSLFSSVMENTAGSLELLAVVLSGIIGTVVGAIHCTLWNARFVNTNGQLLWRVCCITQIIAPILMSVLLAMSSLIYWDEKWDKGALLFALIPCFFQFCARIVIFILIGYSFWSQPADVYRVADWSWSWFPHIS